MAAILNIETATDVCSVCLSVEGEMRWSDTDTKGRNHATVLGGMVAEALDYARQIETMPEAIKWASGQAPTLEAGMTYQISVVKLCAVCVGYKEVTA